MRRRVVIASLVVASAACTMGGQAGAGAPAVCGTGSEKVLLENGAGVITARKDGIFVSCSKRNGNTTEIQIPGDGLTTALPPAMALRGDYLGFVHAFSDIQDLYVTVTVADLRTYGSAEEGRVTGFSADPRDIVYRYDAGTKKLTRLASGKDIDPGSLKRVGGTVRWRQGGRSVSAPMA